MDAILERLRGSSRAEENRRDFLKTQLLFWLLAAPDGHAKNFSVFLERGGAFRMTPLYDIISAWPGVGTAPNKFRLQKIKLAMGVKSKNMHYLLDEIHRQHWSVVAQRNRMGHDFEDVIQDFIARTPNLVSSLQAHLPEDFPANVSDTIFEGITKQIQILERTN